MMFAVKIYSLVLLGVLASFGGFLFLARYNRRRMATVVLAIGLCILVALVAWHSSETYDISRVVIGFYVACHLGYLLAGVTGWVAGSIWRRKTRQ